MASEPKEEAQNNADVGNQEGSAFGWTGRIEEQARKIKEHAETYPYVWASYIFVYGGLGLWFTYRWRKLRKTEDNVRVLQERLRKLYEAEQSNAAAVSAEKPVNSNPSTPSSSDKLAK